MVKSKRELKVTEVELVYKNKVKPEERFFIGSARDAYELLDSTWEEGKMDLHERFKIIFLDNAHRCLAVYNASQGGITACMVDLRLAFATALKARATAMILSHNHPSGKMAFSQSDINLTAKFAQLGGDHDIPVLDHVLMTSNGYLSMADEGMMPVPMQRL